MQKKPVVAWSRSSYSRWVAQRICHRHGMPKQPFQSHWCQSSLVLLVEWKFTLFYFRCPGWCLLRNHGYRWLERLTHLSICPVSPHWRRSPLRMHLPTLLKNKEKSRRSRQMSSSKTITELWGGQLGQMMAISALSMGHKVIALDPAAGCPRTRVAEIIVAPYNEMWALTVSWQTVAMSSLMSLKMSTLTVWMPLSRMDNSLKTDLLRISQNIVFLKRTFSNKGLKSLWHPTVVSSSLDLADISTSKNYVSSRLRLVATMVMEKVLFSEAKNWKQPAR